MIMQSVTTAAIVRDLDAQELIHMAMELSAAPYTDARFRELLSVKEAYTALTGEEMPANK